MAKILIVDDEQDMAALFKEILEAEGYEVSVVNSGKECLLTLSQEKFDLVLMDMFMPELSGRETFKLIRNDEKLKGTKVAFLTVADLGQKGKSELEFFGAVGYLSKSITNDVLLTKVEKMISPTKK
jgi:CheY-like chemotaxis protein